MLNFFSLVTCPIEAISATGFVLAKGTGFLYRAINNQVFLITNWHIVTGRDPYNSTFSKNGAIPTVLRCVFHKKVNDKNKISLRELVKIDIPINDENGTNPNWLEHPKHLYNVDIVAIIIESNKPLENFLSFNVLSKYKGFEEGFIPEPTDNVFVIGYPLGLTGGNKALPLYKRGSIASEYEAMELKIYIDCRTNEGLSGAPVIVRREGIWNPNKELCVDPIFGAENFIGVYSGRLKDSYKNQEVSEIGVVWKKNLIDEIINSKQVGTKLSDISKKN